MMGEVLPNRPLNAIDRGMIRLLRLVREDHWHPEQAARELLRTIGDPRVLPYLVARVQRAIDDRPSTTASRAAQTLRAASEAT